MARVWVDSKQKTVGRYDSDIAAAQVCVPALPSIIRACNGAASASSSDAFQQPNKCCIGDMSQKLSEVWLGFCTLRGICFVP